MKDGYSISELARKLEINKETIRYYEKIGLLSEARRSENGYRVYLKEDIDKIKFILILKKFDFSLKEIKILICKAYDDIWCGNIQNIQSVVKDKMEDIDKKIEELNKTKQLIKKVSEFILANGKQCCGEVQKLLEK
ncbi:helix-turn-helix domain-containing protein [Clostridium hydrogenum]|uniref:helix-turn-helix domain-containing protein n=1 Tax=Clostridium hydrogenum TaxID=2855764 RepID=UPI001F16904A|nr:MerR family transcriptional regulator [Clostridium hydrogenum]